MEKFFNYLKVFGGVSLLAGLIFSGYVVQSNAQEALNTSNETKQQQAADKELLRQTATLAKGIADKLDLLLQLGYISKEDFSRLKDLPKSPLDKNGKKNSQFYILDEERGEIYLIKMPDSCQYEIKTIDLEK